jgi:capsular polysaccharide export protein
VWLYCTDCRPPIASNMQQIAILTHGLWRLRHQVAALSGMEPVWWHRFPRPAVSAFAGWGHASTATRARRLAHSTGKAYLAFEDGPLRSLKPGPAQAPMSLIVDRTGIYYRAGEPSDLLNSIADRAWMGAALRERAERALLHLASLRLSKYNSGPERSATEMGLDPAVSGRVLVLDQVWGDASISGALADADSFQRMLHAAIAENPGREVVVKVHPDVLSGRRRGYLSELARRGTAKVVSASVNPWSLLGAVDKVYTVSSGMGFEAVLAGKDVVCFGSPFYSGWGFTDDRGTPLLRPGAATPAELFAAYYLRYAHYFDAYSREAISFEAAAEQLAWLRDRFMANEMRAVCHRISRWKRCSVERMLDGPAGPPLHVADPHSVVAAAKSTGGPVVTWASRDDQRIRAACAESGVTLLRVEDGFIRSAGLGASFVAPLSLVFDQRGIYYDARAPSDLEQLLNDADFPAPMLARASRLREKIAASGTTKYNVEASDDAAIEPDRHPAILVVGQVEDDASIRHGSPRPISNLDLLRAARERHPAAYIIYKPHPDVDAGFRRGRIPPELVKKYADRLASKTSILGLIAACDRAETITSLAGFEALLRGKPVTTHGQPFYAGWGLTEDLCPIPRRVRRRSLDELVAAALILYPRYLDPVSGLPCGPELLIDRIAARSNRKVTLASHSMRLAQKTAARALYLARSVKGSISRT